MNSDSSEAYISSLIDSLKTQKSYVLLMVTFDFGVLALLVKNLIFLDSTSVFTTLEKFVLVVVLYCFLLSGVLLFWWFSKLQGLSQQAVDLYITNDIKSAIRLHSKGEYWKKFGWIYKVGIVFLWLGIIVSIITTTYKIF